MRISKVDNPDQPYVDALQPIDEKILALLAEREQIAGDQPGIPTWKQVREWANRYGLEEIWLHRVFSTMAVRYPMQGYVEPERLRTVVPLVKRVEAQDCLFEITHMMQYENSSVVFLNVRYLPELKVNFEHHQPLTLTISPGEQQAQSRSMRGGGTLMHYEFVFSPPLPDDLSGVRFGIKKGARQHPPIPTIRLDLSEPILFEE